MGTAATEGRLLLLFGPLSQGWNSSPVVHLPASRVHITPEVPFWQMLLWLHHGAFGAYSQQSWCPSPPRNSPRILGVFLKVARSSPSSPSPPPSPEGSEQETKHNLHGLF